MRYTANSQNIVTINNSDLKVYSNSSFFEVVLQMPLYNWNMQAKKDCGRERIYYKVCVV